MSFSKENQDAWGQLPFSLTIADLEQDDEPLVYVNRGFERMSGYASSAIIGRNCRFLQGEKTDTGTVEQLAKAVRERTDVDATIYNYRANGEGFWNRLVMGPLDESKVEEEGDEASNEKSTSNGKADNEGKPRYFVGIQYDLGQTRGETEQEAMDRQLSEVQHRVKNHLSMVVGLIRLQAGKAKGEEPAEGVFDTLSRRVEALQLLYQEMSEAGSAKATDKTIPLGAYLGRIAAALNHIDGRQGIKVNFNSDTLSVETETAARIGLIVSEVLTNSLQHAFEGRSDGTIEVQARLLTHGVLRISLEDDGVGMAEGHEWPEKGNLGAKIVRMLVKGLDGTLNVVCGHAGTVISLDIPLDRQAQMITDERRA